MFVNVLLSARAGPAGRIGVARAEAMESAEASYRDVLMYAGPAFASRTHTDVDFEGLNALFLKPSLCLCIPAQYSGTPFGERLYRQNHIRTAIASGL